MKTTINNVEYKGQKAVAALATSMGVTFQLTGDMQTRQLIIEADCTEAQMTRLIAAARPAVAHSIV